MNDRSTVLFLSSAGIAGLAALLCAAGWLRRSTAVLTEIRDSLREGVAEARALHHTLRRQRGAINDIHRYLIPVPKGDEKPAR